MKRFILVLLLSSLVIYSIPVAHADTFGSGANSFEIEFVPIGQAGNPADFTGSPSLAGSVDYVYRMGKFEISEQMIDKANAAGSLNITHENFGPNKPAANVSWLEAARFVNWLNSSTGHVPTYKFDSGGELQPWDPADIGYSPDNLFRNRFARYVLPSLDEWYKAAYFDSSEDLYYDYPTGSDQVPDGIDFAGDAAFDLVANDGYYGPLPNDVSDVGLPSPFGTEGQGGNVDEWLETEFILTSTPFLMIRGGSWSAEPVVAISNSYWGAGTAFEELNVGFRVASIPEPAASSLFVLAISFGLIRRQKHKACSTGRNH